MDYVRLGNAGMEVSRICLGCMGFGGLKTGNFSWTLNYEKSKPIIDRAIDLGINFFDTADVYSDGKSEEILGRAIQGRRDDLVIASKVYNPTGPLPNERGLSTRHIRQEVKRSLARLRTRYIDLYQTHRWDYETPIEETLRALDELVRSGSVNYIGASSMWAWQFAKALYKSDSLGLERFVSMQNHYNLCYREEELEMIPLCREENIALLPWSPLARGFLTGKYGRGARPAGKRYSRDQLLQGRYFRKEDFDVLEETVEVAKEKGATVAQVALAWLLHKGVTSPIVGVSSVSQLEELVESTSISLSPHDLKRLEEPYRRRATEGHV